MGKTKFNKYFICWVTEWVKQQLHVLFLLGLEWVSVGKMPGVSLLHTSKTYYYEC